MLCIASYSDVYNILPASPVLSSMHSAPQHAVPSKIYGIFVLSFLVSAKSIMASQQKLMLFTVPDYFKQVPVQVQVTTRR